MSSAVTDSIPRHTSRDDAIRKVSTMDRGGAKDNRRHYSSERGQGGYRGNLSDEEIDEESEGSEGLDSENGEWNDNVEEPELEFDEMGLELAAQDVDVEEPFFLYEKREPPAVDHSVELSPGLLRQMGDKLGKFWDKMWPSEVIVHVSPDDPALEEELERELAREEEEAGTTFRKGAITPDGLIDEDFEKELGSPSHDACRNDPETEYRDIAKYGIVHVAGDDTYGRRVIVFSSCRLPPSTELDHQRLLAYLKHTLDQYVEIDYTLVYFHYGLNSTNKPSFRWLRQAYKEFDRKYKKNLKALYLVHPTNFIKIMWGIFRPLISAKFGKKVMYVNYLHELAQYLQLDQLNIPQRVRDHDEALMRLYKPLDSESHDAFLLAKNKPQPVPTSIIHAPYPTQQFGVSLLFIKEHNKDIIPPVVQQTVSYLRDNGLETEGIFRRSANASVLKEVQQQFNEGVEVDFEKLGDIHLPAAILKSFLRQLQEPLITYDLYDHTVRIQSLDPNEKLEQLKRMLHDELPEDNYYVLKYVISFLVEVASHQDKNRMTPTNLAIVFGPNLMWSKSKTSLASMEYANTCCLYMILNYHQLFSK